MKRIKFPKDFRSTQIYGEQKPECFVIPSTDPHLSEYPAAIWESPNG